jgi:glucose/arabinose dehydrogenase
VILLDNIRGSYNHDGCRLIISPDMKLFITTGDALVQPASQDIDDLSGKVLRINLDGSIPGDNPFPGNPVWSYGHRNAQGLFMAENGILYSSEHGPSTDDEFNIIEAGRNYGWPNVHGFCDLPGEMDFCQQNNVYEPVVAWTPTVAASDIIMYNHPAIPEWQGSILMSTLKNKRIYELEMDASGTQVTGQNQFFNDYWGRLRDICVDPDGAIYLATNGQSWSNNQPFTHSIVKVWNADYLGVGTNEISSIPEMKIFPNPATDYVTIESSPNSNVSISDLAGKRIFEGNNEAGSLKINTQEFDKGVYFIRVESNSYFRTMKLMIVK